MRRLLLILAVGGVAVASLTLGAGAFLFERPTQFSVAVSTQDPEDLALMTAAAARLKQHRKTVRLRLVPTGSSADSSKAVEEGRADLAVVRTDLALPSNAQTVVILHRDAAILVAPASGEIEHVGDLAAHKLGIIRNGPANGRLFETLLSQYEVAPESVTLVPIEPGDVAEAIASKRIDAVMGVGVVSSPMLHDMVKAVMTAGGGAPKFIAVDEAEAVAQRSPLYEKVQVVSGAFGGSPPRPDDEFDTLGVTHRLVAKDSLAQDPITDLTRFFLSERLSLAAAVPTARNIEAPSTDKDAALPVHPGAAAYIDDDEQTFFDKYSDMIYMGAMLLGVLASGATAVLSRIASRRNATMGASLEQVMDMIGQARAAPSPAVLDDLQAQADAILADVLGNSATGGEDGRMQVLGLAFDQLRAAIRDRRTALAVGDRFPGPRPAAAE